MPLFGRPSLTGGVAGSSEAVRARGSDRVRLAVGRRRQCRGRRGRLRPSHAVGEALPVRAVLLLLTGGLFRLGGGLWVRGP
ncbi:hypothetical protein CH313_08510 [Streptomyces sp. TSRI0384-2]|uniref:Uncharacterized protein n=3 Tax=Streptomyces TaxID=1883 RepID=A0A8H9HBG5_9ACTN|nr:hypothetical protein [Streptomyces sp. DSM 41037]PJM83993.1 hypothetical protein CH313_08510 [Streptomyces sp. TSRI0384-2]RPK87847.1 hypothetical protein EES47_16415 [Streptomyces sp. ADI98-12]SUP60287.1 Uncharacterised protein [Streptomyces griseus]GFH73499.1 hypothetical protein Sdia_42670 [Streptomyces diastaticus subsp. diastaticus]GFH79330.1 hypothetical protein Sgou_40000 [Streptomyces gougerotii]